MSRTLPPPVATPQLQPGRDGVVRQTFESAADFFRAAAGARCTWPDAGSRETDSSAWDWTGTPDYDAALQLAWNGWPEGRAMMVAGVSAAATLLAADRAPTYTLDVAGAYPDVALAVAGDPASMRDPCPDAPSRRPVLRLWIDPGASAGVQPEELINRGVAILSHVDALEHAGQPCEVMIARHAFKRSSTRPDYVLTVPVHLPGEVLALDRAAFMLAHPAFLRRLCFAMAENNGSLRHMNRSYSSAGIVGAPDGVVFFHRLTDGAAWRDLAGSVELVGRMIEDAATAAAAE